MVERQRAPLFVQQDLGRIKLAEPVEVGGEVNSVAAVSDVAAGSSISLGDGARLLTRLQHKPALIGKQVAEMLIQNSATNSQNSLSIIGILLLCSSVSF